MQTTCPVENLACARGANLAPIDAGELGMILRKEALRRGHDGDGTAKSFGEFDCLLADRGHDRAVAEIGLDGASVVTVVGELEPAGVPQHVGITGKVNFAATPALATMR
jgi:hypothetical protein